MPRSFVLTNARLVTPEGILDDTTLRVEHGRIAAIGQDVPAGMHEVNVRGNYLFPGFIDMHSDAIEKGIEPRPNTFFPVDIAVFELDKKIASCGITTMFHSLSFAEMEVGLRSNSTAAGIIRQINGFTPRLKVNTKIHARFEITILLARGSFGTSPLSKTTTGRCTARATPRWTVSSTANSKPGKAARLMLLNNWLRSAGNTRLPSLRTMMIPKKKLNGCMEWALP